MSHDPALTCAAFLDGRILASGPLGEVAAVALAQAEPGRVWLFSDEDGRRIELDLTGGPEAALARLTPAPAKGPGRPKLGVVAREVTLLPRHWDWLAAQPGGASVALRKLVEDARRDPRERARQAASAAYRFLGAFREVGDAPGYEEALRALFAGDRAGFTAHAAAWPGDIRDHALALAAPAFGDPS